RGVLSFGPLGSVQAHAVRRRPTFVLLIVLSGLKPCASVVRRHVNHSPSGGFLSIASVTGVMRSSGLGFAGGGGNVTPADSLPPTGSSAGRNTIRTRALE